MSPLKAGTCWYCGKALTPLDYGRADTCTKCGRDTRVCKNCEFYDPAVNNQCHETQADRVVDKERSNFCDFFTPKTGGAGVGQDRDAMKKAAEALFGKK